MVTKQGIHRTPTGIPGLDEIIDGGIPTGSVVCLSGPPGSAKTLFGMQFIYYGIAQNGEKGVYITFEERRESLIKAMAAYGMELEEFEKEGFLTLIDMGKIRRMTSTKERLENKLLEFVALKDLLENLFKTVKVTRLVLDSLVPLSLPYKTTEELREEMFRFTTFLQDHGVTSLLLTESTDQQGEHTRYGVEQFVADGHITIGFNKVKESLIRTLSVRKMRFTKHIMSVHPFFIMNSGIEISPEEFHA